jgi:hypothetical protein
MQLTTILLLCACLLALPVLAAPRHHAAKEARAAIQTLGYFDDWAAATREEAGGLVCYAFSYPSNSSTRLAGRGRAVLTVTERTSGRDAVAFSAGFAFPHNAATTLQVEQSSLAFYTNGRFAFARDGAGTVAALRKARNAIMHSPAPRGGPIADTFSLRGFEAAYAAIGRACPAK